MSYRQTILTNGVKIITVPQPEALSASILVLVNAGAKNEAKEQAGISHFLEHLGFKGTISRPSSMALASELDALGANYNAFTSHDFTGYYVTVISEKVDLAIDLLADLYLHPTYPEVEIQKEKGVVLEEIKMYEDKPSSYVWDVLANLSYGDSPAGRTVLGERETVKSLSREDFLVYRAQKYQAGATTVVVVGNFDEEKVIADLSQKFSEMPTSSEVEKTPILINQQKEPGCSIITKSINQAHLVLSFKTVDFSDSRHYTLNVLASALCGGMSARLFQKIREELGVAYYIGARQETHMDHGFLAIYSGVDADRINEALGAIYGELKKLKMEKISDEEMARVKDTLIGDLVLGLETPSEQTCFYGEQILSGGEVLTPKQYVEKIKSVTAEDLQKIAQDFFVPSKLNLAIVGPELDQTEIKKNIDV